MTQRHTFTVPTWLVQMSHHSTLFFSTQTNPGWTPAHQGSYLLCFPGWYRIDAQGRAQLVGKTHLGEQEAARTTTGVWRDDLELLVGMPLNLALRPYQTRVPCLSIFNPSVLARLSKHTGRTVFPPQSYAQIGFYLYRTDAQGLLQVLGECSPFNVGTFPAFARLVKELTGITGELHFAPQHDQIQQYKGRLHD